MRIDDPEAVSAAPDGGPPEAQPRWRRDFPVDWPADEYRSRREFAGLLLLTSLAFVAGHFWIVALSYLRRARGQPPLLDVAGVDEVPVGGVRVFEYPAKGDPCVLVRLSDGPFRGLRPPLHAPLLPGGAAAGGGAVPLPLPRGPLRPGHGRSPRGSAAAAAAPRHPGGPGRPGRRHGDRRSKEAGRGRAHEPLTLRPQPADDHRDGHPEPHRRDRHPPALAVHRHHGGLPGR